MRLDDALRIEKLQEKGSYSHTFDDGYANEGGTPLGSLIICIGLKAMLEELKNHGNYPDPITLTTEFCGAPGKSEKVNIKVNVNKTGKTFAFLSCQICRENKVLANLHGSFGNLSERVAVVGTMPRHNKKYRGGEGFPIATGRKPEDCVPLEVLFPRRPNQPVGTYSNEVKYYADPVNFKANMNSVISRIKAGEMDQDTSLDCDFGDVWVRERDGRPADVFSVTLWTDTPPMWDSDLGVNYFNSTEWLDAFSTVSETIHFLNKVPENSGAWLRSQQIITLTNRDLVEFEVVLMTPDGTVLAVARQIAFVRLINSKL